MKFSTFTIVTWIACCVVTLAATADDAQELKGSWRVLASNVNGQPSDQVREMDLRMIFKNSQFTLERKGDASGQFEFRLDSSTSPKRVDFIASSTMTMIKGIYEIEGDDLKLCWSQNPRSASSPSSFQSGICFICRRERSASSLPKLDGAWKATLLRDPAEKGLILGERLAKRKIRFVFAGDIVLMQEGGKADRSFRYRVDATQAADVPLQRMTLFGTPAYDIAYEYDRNTLKLFFPGPGDGNDAPKDVPSSGTRIMLVPEDSSHPETLDGRWSVLSIWRDGSRLEQSQVEQMTQSLEFAGDKCTWAGKDQQRVEFTYTTDHTLTPHQISFRGEKLRAAIYELRGPVMKICLPDDMMSPEKRPTDFDSGGLTYVLLRSAVNSNGADEEPPR